MDTEFSCPECHINLDQVKSISPGDTPSPGDIVLCGGCGAILTFDPKYSAGIRVLSKKEIEELSADERRDFDYAVRIILQRAALNSPPPNV